MYRVSHALCINYNAIRMKVKTAFGWIVFARTIPSAPRLSGSNERIGIGAPESVRVATTQLSWDSL